MKHFLLLMLVFSAATSKAQNINFPDPNFKDFLVNIVTYSLGTAPAVDVNGDGEIQQSEAYNYGFLSSTLSLFQHNITDLTGIEYFTTISALNISSINVTTLDLSALNLSSFNLTNAPNLTGANIRFPNPLYFTGFIIRDCNLGAWDLGTSSTHLSNVTIFTSHLTSINVSGCSALSLLQLDNNELTSLNLNGLSNLTHIECSQNQIANLSLSGVATGTLYGYQLTCSQNQLTSLNLAGSRISNLTCKQNTLLTTIDVSNCQFTTLIDCGYCPQLNSIYMKDGNTIGISNFSSTFCPNLRYVCCDRSEQSALQAYYASYGMNNVVIDDLCTFGPGGTPGISYFTISGTVKYDSDENGCTAADPAPAYADIYTHDLYSSYEASTTVDANGYYKVYIPYASALWSVYPTLFGSVDYFNIEQSGGSTDINSQNPQPVVDFCLTKRTDTIGIDLEITVVPKNGVTPGAATSYQVLYRNKGNITQSGTVQLNFNNAKLNFSSANPGQTSVSPGILSWSFANLAPFERRSIDVSFTALPAPQNNIGDTLVFYGIITPAAGTEATPDDNNFEYKQPVIGQYPGNSKVCMETTINPIDYNYNNSKYVHYLVNFQNQGTSTVTNVVIRDTISGKLNSPTLQVLKTSYACSYIRTGNVIEFYFLNINLPPASVDENASKGYIIFKVHTINTEVGDSILNHVSIYFDHDAPIISNTARTGVVNIAVVPVVLEYFKGWRQDNKHLLIWKANCSTGESRFEIERSTDQTKFLSIGNITANNTRCLQPFNFTDANPEKGINYYRIKMTDENGKITYSNVIALLNKNSGFEIISLAPNPVTDKGSFLNIVAAKSQQLSMNVYDASGRIVYQHSQIIAAGSTQVPIDAGKLSNGFYLLKVSTGEGESKTLQFIRQ